ncbi:MAG: alcohol dehydrogenase catalytic domain-containing protein [Nitrospinota bacterium]|nr:alcohol dehydrogenase catalytic domain-containing protein [Nitrospinota bacterium]
MIAKNMWAVVFEKGSIEPQVRQIPIPQPGPGQVLVRMVASPINPSDLSFMRYGAPKTFPFTPGIEGSGTVVAAGPGLYPRLLVGRRVILSESGYGGAWAEYMVTRATACVPLRSSLSFEQGATMLVNPLTALAIMDMARKGKHKAIANNAAASALGRMILRLGKKYGLPVINIVRNQESEDLLRGDGARYILREETPDFDESYRRLAQELKATFILDAVGGELAARMLDGAPAGSFFLAYGNRSEKAMSVNPLAILLERKVISGFYLRNWAAQIGALGVLRNTIRAQALAPNELQTIIQARFPLSQARQALDTARANPRDGKVLFVMNDARIG